MRLGLVVLAHDRGLGRQGWAFHRHLNPTATLAILTSGPQRQRPERYADDPTATLIDLEQLTRRFVRTWVRDHKLDVLLAAESFYIDAFPAWAREAGAKTVVHGNREFLRWIHQPSIPRPDLWLAPSTWDLDVWPSPTVYLPLGVDQEPLADLPDVPRWFLHIAGVPAAADRAGTALIADAMPYMPDRLHVTVRAVTHRRLARMPPRVYKIIGEVDDPAELYSWADLLVSPRRYGGQSLVHLEAVARGIPVLTLDREPERSELAMGVHVPAFKDGRLRTPGGHVDLWSCRPQDLAGTVRQIADEPAVYQAMREAALHLRDRLAWTRLAPVWTDVLEQVSDGRDVPADPAGLLART